MEWRVLGADGEDGEDGSECGVGIKARQTGTCQPLKPEATPSKGQQRFACTHAVSMKWFPPVWLAGFWVQPSFLCLHCPSSLHLLRLQRKPSASSASQIPSSSEALQISLVVVDGKSDAPHVRLEQASNKKSLDGKSRKVDASEYHWQSEDGASMSKKRDGQPNVKYISGFRYNHLWVMALWGSRTVIDELGPMRIRSN